MGLYPMVINVSPRSPYVGGAIFISVGLHRRLFVVGIVPSHDSSRLFSSVDNLLILLVDTFNSRDSVPKSSKRAHFPDR